MNFEPLFKIVAERFDLNKVENPVAFVRRQGDPYQDGFTRVVVLSESKSGGHYNSRAQFHAFQVKKTLLNLLFFLKQLDIDLYVYDIF